MAKFVIEIGESRVITNTFDAPSDQLPESTVTLDEYRQAGGMIVSASERPKVAGLLPDSVTDITVFARNRRS